MSLKRIPRIGIGGPVDLQGYLIEQVVPILSSKGYQVGIISNDVVSREDADRMRLNIATERGLMPVKLVIGVAIGGSPHTTLRDDPDEHFHSRRSGNKPHLP